MIKDMIYIFLLQIRWHGFLKDVAIKMPTCGQGLTCGNDDFSGNKYPDLQVLYQTFNFSVSL